MYYDTHVKIKKILEHFEHFLRYSRKYSECSVFFQSIRICMHPEYIFTGFNWVLSVLWIQKQKRFLQVCYIIDGARFASGVKAKKSFNTFCVECGKWILQNHFEICIVYLNCFEHKWCNSGRKIWHTVYGIRIR